MPVKINDKFLVPAPLVTFDKSFIIGGDGQSVGATYTINLDGKILPNKGNPVVDSGNFLSSFSSDAWTSTKSPDDDPLHDLDLDDNLLSIMSKQEQIQDLFRRGEAIKVEILDLNLRNGGEGVKFVGNVQSISFPNEGNWSMPCTYAVSITTNNFIESVGSGVAPDDSSVDKFNYFVSNASESWDIEESDDKLFRSHDQPNVKVYNISHSISAVGQNVYSDSGSFDGSGNYTSPYLNNLAPWQQASGYVVNVLGTGVSNFPGGIFNINNDSFTFGDDFFENSGVDTYIVADHTVTESIDVRGGSYNLSENFTAYPSGAFNGGYPVVSTNNVNVNIGEAGLTDVTIDGTIRGLNTMGLNGDNRHLDNSALNASDYFDNYINGTIAPSYGSSTADNKRVYFIARNASNLQWLHPKEKSSSKGINYNGGVITYNYSYDNRPPNIIQGSIKEDISIQDTYPGQIFASIPVIGRNQPVLQYLNSRSEYKRNLNITIQMAPFEKNWIEDSGSIIANSGYWPSATGISTSSDPSINDGLSWWLYSKKPSVTNSSNFQKIFDAANPANETAANGFSNPVVANRTFYGPPNESWNPNTGQYTYSIEWTFERSN